MPCTTPGFKAGPVCRHSRCALPHASPFIPRGFGPRPDRRPARRAAGAAWPAGGRRGLAIGVRRVARGNGHEGGAQDMPLAGGPGLAVVARRLRHHHGGRAGVLRDVLARPAAAARDLDRRARLRRRLGTAGDRDPARRPDGPGQRRRGPRPAGQRPPAAKSVAATVLGVVLLAAGASSMFGELRSALDRIWRVPGPRIAKPWLALVRSRVLSLGMILAPGLPAHRLAGRQRRIERPGPHP